MTGCNEQLRARHGATMVLVAVLIVVLGGMGAFAIDLARVYSGVNEMQTGADAAALAGALKLQRYPAASPVASVQNFAAGNTAFGTAISVAAGDVEPGYWDPADNSFSTPRAWSASNAVRVTTHSSPTLAFGRLLNRSSLTANRSSIAWIANQVTRDCIKPWGVPLGQLTTKLGGLSITTQAGVNALRTLVSTLAGRYSATMILGPNINNPRGSPNTPDATFLALTGNNSSRKEYQNAIIGQNCEGNTDYTVGTNDQDIATQPGQGNGDIPRTTSNAIQLTCQGQQCVGGVLTCRVQTDVRDATCYDPASGAPVAGVTVTLAVATQVGSNSATINGFLSFRLMCVFRGGNGNQPGGSSNQESCPWLVSAGRTANNFVEGTLVGYPMPSVAISGSGNGLGNAIGGAQKLVLVR